MKHSALKCKISPRGSNSQRCLRQGVVVQYSAQHGANRLPDSIAMSGKQQLFESLLPWLVGDTMTPAVRSGRKCGVSIPHFRVHLHRLRKRYSQELRNQILDTLDDDEEFEDEVKRLFQISKNTA